MMRLLRCLAVILALAAPCAARAQDGAPRTITLASTTSVENSGLLAHILPRFTRATGITVRVLAQGTGQALATAARGDADLVLAHDPEAEARFMAEGHGAGRREVAWNSYVLVGPASDPARTGAEREAAAALRAIWQARAPFVSRGDRSGTDALEKRLWRAAGLDPARAEGGWYRDIGGGMGAALNAAAAMDAYTLSDRGTWLSFANKRGLRVTFEGGRDLLNTYSVITLNPAGRDAAAHRAAAVLAEWLVSAEGQEAIGSHRVAGQALFHPAADPKP